MADNAIDTIELDAFVELQQMEHLSLRNNRLTQFDNRILEKAISLRSINLSGNKFMYLAANVPLLRSRSLQYIDLHDAQVPALYANTFHEMPYLHTIDLSGNLLITIGQPVFNRSHQLKWLNVTGNPLICDENMQRTMRRWRQRRVNVAISDCGE